MLPRPIVSRYSSNSSPIIFCSSATGPRSPKARLSVWRPFRVALLCESSVSVGCARTCSASARLNEDKLSNPGRVPNCLERTSISGLKRFAAFWRSPVSVAAMAVKEKASRFPGSDFKASSLAASAASGLPRTRCALARLVAASEWPGSIFSVSR